MGPQGSETGTQPPTFGAGVTPEDRERAESSRSKRVGRVFLSTFMGYLGGAVGGLLVIATFNAACGNGFGLDLENIDFGCALAMGLTNLVATPLFVGGGTALSASWLDGLGSYWSAVLGAASGFAAAFVGTTAGLSFGGAVLIGSILAPPMATVFYEMSSAAEEHRLSGGLTGRAVLLPVADRHHGTTGAALGWIAVF